MSRLVIYVFGLVLLASCCLTTANDSVEKPENDDAKEENETLDNNNSTGNGTGQDLYVIRQVVYEIGILTDAGNDTSSSNETHEEIDLSFFDPHHNGSSFDLSHIPVPIETNVSGVALTGLVKANLGALLSPNTNGTDVDFDNNTLPLYPDKQIRVTHNISTVNKDTGTALLSNLNQVLGLDKLTKKNETDKETTTDVKATTVASEVKS